MAARSTIPTVLFLFLLAESALLKGIALGIFLLMPLSRLYLTLHFPGDVRERVFRRCLGEGYKARTA